MGCARLGARILPASAKMSRDEIPIHFCVAGGRAIFLDLRRNRYFALAAAVNDAFVTTAGDITFGAIKVQAFHGMASGKMPDDFTIVCPSVLGAYGITEPECDHFPLRDGNGAHLLHTVLAWLAFLMAKFLIWICPLDMILGGLRTNTSKMTPKSYDTHTVKKLVSAFLSLNLLISSDGNCLPLTLAFVWMCRLFGYNPALVIGVRINPFSAHCWSQVGETVLNDSFERVRLYQPILIV